MKQQLLRYWLAMNASAVQAGTHAGRAFFALAGAHAVQAEIPPINLQQFGAVFLLAFGMEILRYLDANPLPVIPQTQTTMETGKMPVLRT